MYFFGISVQLVSKILLSLRRIERDVIKNVCRTSCKVSVIIVRFQLMLNFLDKVSKITEIQNFMKIRPVDPSCSMRMNVRTAERQR